MKRFKEYSNRMIAMYPDLKDQILDLYDLAEMEIDDGASPQNEYELFVNSVDDLIREQL